MLCSTQRVSVSCDPIAVHGAQNYVRNLVQINHLAVSKDRLFAQKSVYQSRELRSITPSEASISVVECRKCCGDSSQEEGVSMFLMGSKHHECGNVEEFEPGERVGAWKHLLRDHNTIR